MLMLATSVALFGNDIVISTGAKSKTFYKIGTNIQGVVPNVDVITSKGSIENLENIKNGKANVALTFADAYKSYITKYPEMANKTTILGTAGYGCLYAAVRKDGKVSNEDDLQKKDIKVAIGKRGAGSNATWEFMGQLDKDYKNPIIEYSGDNIALGKLKSGQLDAVLQMQNPSLDNAIVKAVNSSKDLEFISIDDYSLNDTLPDGQPVYRYKNVSVSSGVFVNSSVKTICSDTLVIVDTGLDEEMHEAIANVLVNNQSTVLSGTIDK